MDLFKAADFYIDRLVNSQAKTSLHKDDGNLNRIKILLLDKDTKSTISMCATQNDLLDHDIYLVDTIENLDRDYERHLKCLCYVRPTDETIEYLMNELRDPHYGEYHLFFSNWVTKSQLERLAESDDMEAVVKIEELFQDYYVLNTHLFSFDLRPQQIFGGQVDGMAKNWAKEGLNVVTNNLTSLLLSLKLKPRIHYQTKSKMAMRLAQEVSREIKQNERTVFDFPQIDSAPLLIIMDRRFDLLTPLLQPWTYQSMIHEYIGLSKNIVDLSNIGSVTEDTNDFSQKVTLSSKQDNFFKETMYMNFGELGDKIKEYVDLYRSQTKNKSSDSLQSIEDIKMFIEKYPEFRRLSGNVSKHMAIVSELDRQLKELKVWTISELEQNLAVHKDSNDDFQQLMALIKDVQIPSYYKLKLACVYLLKHHDNEPRAQELRQAFSTNVLDPELCDALQKYELLIQEVVKNGTDVRSDKKSEDLLSELTKKFNNTRIGRLSKSKGEEESNVYMQHVPDISMVISNISKPEHSELFSDVASGKPAKDISAQDIVIFIIGGVTYEEARWVEKFNNSMDDKVKIIVGGTKILNTREFSTEYIQAL